MARKMTSAFPNFGSDKAEYLVTLTEFLTRWPMPVVEAVCDPFNGIASRQQFVPSIFEMREALEVEARQQTEDRRRASDLRIMAPLSNELLRRLLYHGLAHLPAKDSQYIEWTDKGVRNGCPLDGLPPAPPDYVAPITI